MSKISQSQFFREVMNKSYADALVDEMGYVYWTTKERLAIRDVSANPTVKARSRVLYLADIYQMAGGRPAFNQLAMNTNDRNIYYQQEVVAVVMPAFEDGDFDQKKKDSETALLELFRKRLKLPDGKPDEASILKFKYQIENDMLSLMSDMPSSIRYSPEIATYFDYHRGFESRRWAQKEYEKSLPYSGSTPQAEGGQDSTDISTLVGILLATGSLTTEIGLASKNYDYLAKLAGAGKFLGTKGGVLMEMDKTYLGTARMAATRGAEQAQFLAKLSKLKFLKFGGTSLGIFGTGISVNSFIQAETSDQKFSAGLDIGIGVVGFFGPWGAAISFGSTINKALAPSMLQYNIERSERISKGDYSMLLWQPGRALR